MLTINFQAWVQGPTARHLVWIKAQGTTPEEVIADAARQSVAIKAISLETVGLHNREADWIAVFGADYDAQSKFADSPGVMPPPCQPPPTLWSRFLKWLS